MSKASIVGAWNIVRKLPDGGTASIATGVFPGEAPSRQRRLSGQAMSSNGHFDVTGIA